MGKGAKKTSKLVKQEKQEKPKKFDKEEDSSVPQSHLPPSFPSPIPEEAEGFAAQGSVHGDDQPLDSTAFAGNSWGVSTDPAGTWLPSGNPSQAASPHLGDRKFSATPGSSSRVASWAGSISGGSYDQQHKYYLPSPHPGLAGNPGSDLVAVDFERKISRSNDESELEYASEEPSDMATSSNIGQHWDSQSQPQPGHGRAPAPSSAPTFPVYATSLSNPPFPPDPLPTAPNVVSRASEAAARLDKSKKGDLPPPPPPQPQYVPPPNSAAWRSWLKPNVYKPSFEQPVPPQGPHPIPRQSATASVHSGMPSSLPKGMSSNPPRGVWEIRPSKGGPWGHQPSGGAQGVGMGAGGSWNQHRSSADGWAGYQGKGNHDGWNEGGGDWGKANNGGWYDDGKKGHGRSKSAGAWGGKRNVQWEESEQEESDETEDDGWGEEDDGGDWEQADGLGKANDQWGNAERTWGDSGGTGWTKPDNDGTGGGWGQESLGQGGAWGAQPTSMHGWGEDSGRGRKATNAPLGATGIKGVVSPQQRTQILNSLLNMTDQKQAGNTTRRSQRSNKPISKQGKGEKENKRQTRYNAGWGLEDGPWGNIQEEDENVKGDRTRSSSSKRTSAAWDVWGGSQDASRYSMPSMTLAHAYKDSKTRLDSGSQNKLSDVTRMRFHESKGAALLPVQNVFFSPTRLARDRLHWSFPPDKDERVRAALAWIQEMSYGLGTLGLHKFLQHRERGALVINVDHKLADKPSEFIVDYLTFDDLQKSFDKTLQSSVISYDPAVQVIVFAFLPSKSGNSVAIWRRKLIVPNNVRLRFQNELDIALGGLKDPKEYKVYVDEVPKGKKELLNVPRDEPKPKKKRKWWQFFKSKS